MKQLQFWVDTHDWKHDDIKIYKWKKDSKITRRDSKIIKKNNSFLLICSNVKQCGSNFRILILRWQFDTHG